MGKIFNARLSNQSNACISIENGLITAISNENAPTSALHPLNEALDLNAGNFDAAGLRLLPAMIDMHVHSRNPGYPHKETWQTLARSAFKGGVLGIADMPNTNPPTLFAKDVLEKVAAAAAVGLPAKVFLGVTEENVDQLKTIIAEVRPHLAGLKIYYGKSTGGLIFDDLDRLRQGLGDANILLVFHSEDQCCIDATRANYGPEFDSEKFSDFVIHSRVRSKAAAIKSTVKLLDWATSVQCPFHLAHMSTPEEVALIQEAKARGLKATSEVAPHHLILSEDDYPRLGPFIKVNPPVRAKEDVAKMRQFFKEGLFDAIATDHAPHTKAEKLQSLGKSPSGIPAIEFFTPLLWQLGKELAVADSDLVKMGASNPARLAGFKESGSIEVGKKANLVLLAEREYNIRADSLECQSKWSPYEGMKLSFSVDGTWHLGKRVYSPTKGISG